MRGAAAETELIDGARVRAGLDISSSDRLHPAACSHLAGQVQQMPAEEPAVLTPKTSTDPL